MKNISERISKAVAGFPEGRMKDTDKPEKATEELWALWREFRPLSLKKEKSEAEKARSEILLLAIAERWRNSAVRESVSKTLRQEIQEREKGILAGLEYDQIRKQRDKNEARRLELFKQIFKSDGVETGELEQIELAELAGEIEVDNQVLEQQEKANPELAARLSFERLRRYQRELAKGFIWTPSRHKYFNELLHRAVVLNQNRPVLIYGESGTGKTRLIREAAKRLSGEPAFEVGEEAKDDIRPLLGKRTIDTEGDYIIYGPLARALIGKQTSRDTKAEAGGVFYMDEMNGYPAGGLRALIKQVSGLKPGDTISFAAWGGKREKVAPGFVFVGSANLLSEKHPDRPDLPNELKRELAPSSFEVDYPP
jgi:DNA replication protein DnaC